jgi:hypothetical protein
MSLILQRDDLFRTGENSTAQIKLADGTQSMLARDSLVIIRSLLTSSARRPKRMASGTKERRKGVQQAVESTASAPMRSSSPSGPEGWEIRRLIDYGNA